MYDKDILLWTMSYFAIFVLYTHTHFLITSKFYRVTSVRTNMSNPVAIYCQEQVCGRFFTGMMGSKEPADGMGTRLFVCCVGSGLCDGLITCLGETYWFCV